MNIACRLLLGCTLVLLLNHGQVRGQQGTAEFDPCAALRFTPLEEIEVRLPRDDGRLPPDCSAPYIQERISGDVRRFATPKPVYWAPTNFFHEPVYFDNVPLERYGQTCHPHFEPVFSGVRFALGLPVLPYRMGLDPPHECITTLGHLPPGDCVPCIKQTLPLAWDAAFVEAATAVGLVLLLP